MPETDDNLIILSKGEPLFEKGDKGGPVYNIITGEILIYTVKDSKEIELTTMQQGEVIGTVSCLTDSHRFASAKALTDATLKVFTAEQLRQMIEKLPKSIKIIVKDITHRIASMNEKYIEAISQMEKISQKEASDRYLARQVCTAMATISSLIAIDIDEKKGVFPEDLLSLVSESLGIEEKETKKFYDILIDCGLIKLSIDPEKKKKYFTLKNAKSLTSFAKFLKDSNHGNIKKLVQTEITPKQKRLISGLIRYALKTDPNPHSKLKVSFSDLEKDLYNKGVAKYCEETLLSLRDLPFFEVDDKDKDKEPILIFIPSDVSKTIAHLSAYNKIESLIQTGTDPTLEENELAS